MASTSNNRIPSNGTSSSGAFIVTPPSSSYAATHASAASSNNTTTDSPPWVPSYQLQVYLSQPARNDVWSAYGRLANQPQTVDPNGYIAHHTGHAQQAIARFDERFHR